MRIMLNDFLRVSNYQKINKNAKRDEESIFIEAVETLRSKILRFLHSYSK